MSYFCDKSNKEMKEKSLNEIRGMVEDMPFLSIENAQNLLGKKVQIYYPGYLDQDGTNVFSVGKIVSEIDYYRFYDDSFSNEKYKNRAEYWESYMTPEQLYEHSNKLCLLDADNKLTYCFSYKEGPDAGFFFCGDVFRYVKFLVL